MRCVLVIQPLDQIAHVGVSPSISIKLISREIIFEVYQTVILIYQRHRQTDKRTDRRTTCNCKTALCTIVHRAVKTN